MPTVTVSISSAKHTKTRTTRTGINYNKLQECIRTPVIFDIIQECIRTPVIFDIKDTECTSPADEAADATG